MLPSKVRQLNVPKAMCLKVTKNKSTSETKIENRERIHSAPGTLWITNVVSTLGK
jgi:hypothetical protein